MVGAAMAFQFRDEPNVALAICGDGATSTGTWHESVNFASAFSAPIVFLIENNQYAYSTPIDRQFKIERLADRAAAYGIPGTRIDGNDVLEVYTTVREAVDRSRSGNGPSIIEAMTMRIDGHAIHDAADYVPVQLTEQWKQRDPILLAEEQLRGIGVPQSSIAEWKTEAVDRVAQAAKVAREAPKPDPSTLLDGVYAEPTDVRRIHVDSRVDAEK
jgi:TPP-dependent pyruvate/acetoin dehydrogenase alpha subunit